MPSIASYFNPLSSHHHAVKEFGELSAGHKIKVVAITALITFCTIGIGSVAGFRYFTHKSYQAEKISRGYSTTTRGVDSAAGRAIGGSVDLMTRVNSFNPKQCGDVTGLILAINSLKIAFETDAETADQPKKKMYSDIALLLGCYEGVLRDVETYRSPLEFDEAADLFSPFVKEIKGIVENGRNKKEQILQIANITRTITQGVPAKKI